MPVHAQRRHRIDDTEPRYDEYRSEIGQRRKGRALARREASQEAPQARQAPQAPAQAQAPQARPPFRLQAAWHNRGRAAKRPGLAACPLSRPGRIAGRADLARAGAAALVARGLRTGTRAGRGAGRAAAQTGRLRPHTPLRAGNAHWPGTGRRRRPSARPRRRVGSGPLLVARSHGPLRPAARGADDVHLPRLVRQLQREGQQPAADARPEQPVPLDGARQLPRPVRSSDHQPRDARLPRRDLQQRRKPERELRARDDGAVLAGSRPRRLHRG